MSKAQDLTQYIAVAKEILLTFKNAPRSTYALTMAASDLLVNILDTKQLKSQAQSFNQPQHLYM